MQATEMSRERDNLTLQVTTLRSELSEAKNEVVNVRRSIVEEKQSLETRLAEVYVMIPPCVPLPI